jgi:hypothetical protein
LDTSEKDEIIRILNKRIKTLTDGIEMLHDDIRFLKKYVGILYLINVVILTFTFAILALK